MRHLKGSKFLMDGVPSPRQCVALHEGATTAVVVGDSYFRQFLARMGKTIFSLG